MPRRLVQVAAVASTFRTSSRTLRHPPHPPANGRHERDHWPPAPTRSSPARLEAVASPRFRRSLATVSASVCKHRSCHGMAADTAPSARWAPTKVPSGAMRLARTTATTGARTWTARRTTRVRDGSVARTGPPPPPPRFALVAPCLAGRALGEGRQRGCHGQASSPCPRGARDRDRGRVSTTPRGLDCHRRGRPAVGGRGGWGSGTRSWWECGRGGCGDVGERGGARRGGSGIRS